MVVLAVTWMAKAGRETEVSAIFAKLTEESRKEPGCAMYQVHRHKTESRRFFIYEQYKDDAALEVILGNVDRIVRVSEEEIRMAMRFYFTDTHNVVEGAGAAGLAAALKERQLIRGKRIGLVATGGNVDHDVFARVLQD